MSGDQAGGAHGAGQKRARHQALKFSGGLALLLFAGYAIGWHSLALSPAHVVLLLGGDRLPAGGPAGFRVIGMNAQGGGPLPLTGVDLFLEQAGRRAILARALPRGPVAEVAVRMPAWSGPAELKARIRTARGTTELNARVDLAHGTGSTGGVLRLVRPSVEWVAPPEYEGAGAGGPGVPTSIQPFPEGGGLLGDMPGRVWVRIADSAGKPVSGQLWLDGSPVGRAGTDGMAAVEVPAAQRGPLRIVFAAGSGRLEARLDLVRVEAPFDLDLSPRLVTSGKTLEVQLRSLEKSGTLYLDAWWKEGVFAFGHSDLQDGRAAVVLPVPDGISGPLVVRVGGDPEGRGRAVRTVGAWALPVGSSGGSTAMAGLVRMTPDGVFWSEASPLLTGGRASLIALLSRMRAPDGPLPVLADSRRTVLKPGTAGPSEVAVLSLWLTGITSWLLWLVVCWMLVAGRRSAPPELSRRSLRIRILAGSALGLLLGAGWLWLFFSCR